jgi:hypothetical protein
MSMRQEPEFYALVDEPNAGEAYLATLSALYDPVVANDPKRHRFEFDVAREGSSLEEVLAVKRETLCCGYAGTRIPFLTRSQRYLLDVILGIERVRDGEGSRSSQLSVRNTDIMHQDFIVPSDFYDAAARDELSVPVSAAILGHIWQGHLDQVFLAMCAPDAQSRVKMGVYNVLDKLYGIDLENGIGSIGWHAAVEMAATYHGNHEVARDLAFSWLHLHDGRAIDSVVHLSLDDLITRVEAVPRGTSIGIASRTEHVVKHGFEQSNACTLAKDQVTAMNWSVGPRVRYPEDDELTREHVLATLQTPSETLLQALEAAAVPDGEWRDAEKRALDVLDGLNKEGEPSRWLRLDRFEQRCFLEEHAPYHVRRLPNGGVMLAAYPYRYLWPLWASALDLLGIRPKTTT